MDEIPHGLPGISSRWVKRTSSPRTCSTPTPLHPAPILHVFTSFYIRPLILTAGLNKLLSHSSPLFFLSIPFFYIWIHLHITTFAKCFPVRWRCMKHFTEMFIMYLFTPLSSCWIHPSFPFISLLLIPRTSETSLSISFWFLVSVWVFPTLQPKGRHHKLPTLPFLPILRLSSLSPMIHFLCCAKGRGEPKIPAMPCSNSVYLIFYFKKHICFILGVRHPWSYFALYGQVCVLSVPSNKIQVSQETKIEFGSLRRCTNNIFVNTLKPCTAIEAFTFIYIFN